MSLKKSTEPVSIPQPMTYGLLKNIPSITKDAPSQSFLKLADEFGDIFRFETPKGFNLFISGHDLVEDACDENRFDKFVGPPLQKLRAFGGDGLFTARTHEVNWQKAHRILVPNFSQRAMQGYHTMMTDMASQLVQKWLRLNPEDEIDVAEDMSRLTYDTIGLCGFSYRFNSFYREEMHPFVRSMARALHEAMNQLWRFGIHQKLVIRRNQQFKTDIETMNRLVDQMIQNRKEQKESSQKDLLFSMLNSQDPETGEGLNDKNIRYQMITFLIAGHETTSGLLTFALYFLIKHPEVLGKAYEEVDRVMTGPEPTYEEVRGLRYIWMILNESLRLWPTAPSFAVYAKQDTVLAGKYPIKKGTGLTILIPKLHRDKRAWGEDADKFIPERFEDMTTVPHHAFKPFGNGQRACIGQLFAMHEATLALGMILKHFELLDPYQYKLKIKETLTLKPDQFKIKVRPRQKATFVMQVKEPKQTTQHPHPIFNEKITFHQTPLLVLYGSDLGTAESIARDFADKAESFGFRSEVGSLNDYVDRLPKKGALLIVTSSYNGNSPVRAKRFVDWLQQLGPRSLEGIPYAVFGCGDQNWKSTYQAIPRLIDEKMAACGARRITERGEGDASHDFEEQLLDWEGQFWPDLGRFLTIDFPTPLNQPQVKRLSLEFVSESKEIPIKKNYEAGWACVLKNVELQTNESLRSTRHIELELPLGMSFQVGDHLGVIPRHQKQLVERVLKRFGINQEASIILHSSGKRAEHFPLEHPVRAYDVIRNSVELLEPATRSMIRELVATTHCPPHKKELMALLEDDVYHEQVFKKRVSLLDLLEKFESCELSFERFLEVLPPLKARYYSISNAPVAQIPDDHDELAASIMTRPVVASLTVAVVEGEAWSGKGSYKGVASNYLATLDEGDQLAVFVKCPEPPFTLPKNPETPIIMVGTGTGLAPFRGFLQVREGLKKAGDQIGETHLYFGCRSDDDFIYGKELSRFQEAGVSSLHVAFSRKTSIPKTYVQHLVQKNASDILRLLNQGSHIYVCGDASHMAPDVEETLIDIYEERNEVLKEEAKAWLESLQSEGRYLKDVW